MIEIERTCADQFGLALANTTDPTVVIIPVRTFAEMQAVSQAAFAGAVMTYMVISLVIGLCIGAGVMWLVNRYPREDPGDDE
jgi:hypothetical protein